MIQTREDRARLAAEVQRLEAAYGRRREGDRYSCFNPGQLFLLQQRERQVLALLRSQGLSRLQGRKILEIGCGDGIWLGDFIKWGAEPGNLTGLDLLPGAPAAARANLPARVSLIQADGAYLPLAAGTFDLVLQSTVFTSILDPLMKQSVAREMLRVLKPQGLILWYDYHLNNPANPDVRGVKKAEIHRLFPGCDITLRRLTLAPPIARRLAPHSFLLCYLLEELRFLNSHYLGVIRKPA
jgi:SAM-dependent methyltransferase